jgi:hypothetical protein
MKIAKDRLKKIIKEELEMSDVGMHGGHHEEHDQEGRMAKSNLYKIAEYATQLCKILKDDDNLEGWVEEKIAVAAYIMDTVGHYMEYEHVRDTKGDAEDNAGHEEGEMELDFDDEDGVEYDSEDEENFEEPSEEEFSDEDEEEEY